MKATKSGGFTIRRVLLSEKGVRYETFWLRGWINGQRVRKQFKSRELALGEFNRLSVLAANSDGHQVHPVNTRLSPAQVRAAETAFDRLGEFPLAAAIDWFLTNYRAPLVSRAVETATAEFMRDREGVVSLPVVVDYRKVMKLLLTAFPGRQVDSLTTADVEKIMGTWGQSKKSWNNLRTYLHAFFAFCANPTRRWVETNPVKAIVRFELSRGLPQVMPVERVAELFAYLETYSGPPRSGHKPGYLVPYFALATFAGIRPSVRDGEIRKIHEMVDKERIVDLKVGVIRITPEIAKTNDLRQVTIQPNLAAWLNQFRITNHPLITANMMDHVGIVRQKFGLSPDVLRHTFISMYVAKFKSLGAAALEAGNSEAIIRRQRIGSRGTWRGAGTETTIGSRLTRCHPT